MLAATARGSRRIVAKDVLVARLHLASAQENVVGFGEAQPDGNYPLCYAIPGLHLAKGSHMLGASPGVSLSELFNKNRVAL